MEGPVVWTGPFYRSKEGALRRVLSLIKQVRILYP